MESATTEILKKYQNFIFPFVAVLIGFTLLGLVIVPQGLKIPETNSQIETIRNSVQALNAKITQLNSIDVNKYQDDLKVALTALPNDKDLPGVMILIFNLFKNNSLTLNGISFSAQSAAETGTSDFIIKADVSGTKDSLTTTIDQLKESPRIIKVSSLSTSAALDSTTLEIIIGLDSFYKPLPTEQDLDLEKPVDLPNSKNLQTLETIRGFQTKNAPVLEATGPAIPLGKTDPFN